MADYEALKQRLLTEYNKDASALMDCLTLCVETDDHDANKQIRAFAAELVKTEGSAKALDVYNRTLRFDAPIDFDCFMRCLEHNRPMQEQFWIPRRKKLMPVCKALQDMEDGKLDELFLSCPPRIGKSTLMLMFFLWVMGRDSERSNLYCSYTDSVVGVLYNGILEVLTDPVTYAYADCFPGKKVASTDAKDKLLNLDRKKRYASFTGRSLYGTLNGACDCNGYLVGDDLISGIEEALSADRLNAAWAKVDNNMIPRAKESAKILWIGTRWSLIDPQGKRLDLLANDPKYKDRRVLVLNTPALDDNDESNFDYDFGVGFSTEYFQQRRASFERNNDMASWEAQYQGQPIERKGAVFQPDDLRFYNGVLPEVTPDRIFVIVDPSWGGGDFLATVAIVQYGVDLYVPGVLFCNEDKKVTQPMLCGFVKRFNASAMKIEATKTTASYGEDVDKMLRKDGYKINMTLNTSHFTGTGKRDRIIACAPDIRERMIFLQDGCRPKEYQKFMQNLYSFTFDGTVKHDDAPDVCAMVIDYVDRGVSFKAEVMKSPIRR